MILRFKVVIGGIKTVGQFATETEAFDALRRYANRAESQRRFALSAPAVIWKWSGWTRTWEKYEECPLSEFAPKG